MIAAAQRHRAQPTLRVFGSIPRGIAQSASDVDLLVDTLPGATLFDLGALKGQVEELPDARVDLLTRVTCPFRSAMPDFSKPSRCERRRG